MEEIHHANIVVGEGNCRDFVFSILKTRLNFSANANPDFLFMESPSFGIDDVRSLEKWVIGKPLLGEVKASLIITKSISHEAQNALLKILEEPPLGTYIFINLENPGGLLPTLLSRVRILDISLEFSRTKKMSQSISSRLVNSDPKERFSLVHSMLESKDKTDMKEIIRDLERISYENYKKNTSNGFLEANNMRNLLVANVFASVRGSSPKMLLEWLSCVL